MIICVSGTPGTGKTTVAKLIAKKYKLKYFDANKLIKGDIVTGYDKIRKCRIINEKRLIKELIKIIKREKNLVIDSHYSHEIPSKYVDLCIITKCSLKTLKKRLKKRRYSDIKIKENLEYEAFDGALVDALENKHRVKIINTDIKKKGLLNIL